MKSIELKPDNKYYRLALARLYQSVGFFIDATKTYEDILLKYPD